MLVVWAEMAVEKMKRVLLCKGEGEGRTINGAEKWLQHHKPQQKLLIDPFFQPRAQKLCHQKEALLHSLSLLFLIDDRTETASMPKDKTSPDKSEKLVLDYLIKQNRPYSVTDIVSNLHAAVSKTECQRVINVLVEKDLVTTKLYGKQSIYVIRQDTIDVATPQEMAAIDNEMRLLQGQIAESKARHKQLSSELSALNSALTTDQITARLDQLKAKNVQAEEHLSLLRSGNQLVTREEKQRVAKEMEFYRKMWNQRRRIFKDMFATVTENMPGNPKDLLEELDIAMQDPINININPRELAQA